jgi:hypothetical protein
MLTAGDTTIVSVIDAGEGFAGFAPFERKKTSHAS